MSEESWTDRIVGARMAVDRSFADRVQESQFSNQEWSLIMTATTFEIDRPDEPADARLFANTDHLGEVLPELEKIRSQPGAMGGPGGSGGSAGGFFSGIKRALGVGNDDSSRRDDRAAAESLTAEYATKLQAHLQENGRWEAVCEAASDEVTDS